VGADPQQLSALAQYAAVLEACALAHARGSHEVFSSTIARLTHSLDSNGAHVVRKYPVSALCNLSHRRLQEETAHEKRDAAIVARVNRLIDLARGQDARAKDRAKSVVVDQAIRCPRCKTQDGITRMPVQGNSADEGMKTACMCAACGKQWEIAS
jgi:DNA-directed RNA polymerase subunit M/transcription elongation factor TFIIS